MTYCTRTRCSRYRMVAAVLVRMGGATAGSATSSRRPFPPAPSCRRAGSPTAARDASGGPRRGSPPLGRRNSGANGFGIRRTTWQEYGPLTADVALDRRAVDVALDSAHHFPQLVHVTLQALHPSNQLLKTLMV